MDIIPFLAWGATSLLVGILFRVLTHNWSVMLLTAIGIGLGMLLPRIVLILADLLSTKLTFSPVLFRTFFKNVLQRTPYRSKSLFAGIMYSYVMLGAFFSTMLYVMTSSQGTMGKAVVLGCGLSLVLNLVRLRPDKTALKTQWFSHFKAKLSDTELDLFVWGSLMLWIAITVIGLHI